MFTIIFRLLLTIALVIGVYYETGIYTALSFSLIFASYELQNLLAWLEVVLVSKWDTPEEDKEGFII